MTTGIEIYIYFEIVESFLEFQFVTHSDGGTVTEQSLMVLKEWCSRWGMKVNAEKSAIIHFRKNRVCSGTMSFPSGKR